MWRCSISKLDVRLTRYLRMRGLHSPGITRTEPHVSLFRRNPRALAYEHAMRALESSVRGPTDDIMDIGSL